MQEISKVSDITAYDLADYMRLVEPDAGDINFLNASLMVAKDYILEYTGIEEEDLDNFKDMVIVVFVLCQDMYDNRSMYVDNSHVNRVVDTILGLHQRNLL